MGTSLAYELFQKKIDEISVEDLAQFFSTEKRENNVLEFKSYVDFPVSGTTKTQRDKEKVSDIISTITAFLNSDGGIIVWGAPVGKKPPEEIEKVFVGDLSPVQIKLEKDQFINRIATEISPTPMNILFKRLDITSSTFCYIISIERSDFSPHQYKGTYYMRLDGATHTAPHHYVEALIKKISYPKIKSFLNFGRIRDYRNDIAAFPAQLTIHNTSRFTHEKNLFYRIVTVGANVRNPHQHSQWSRLTLQDDLNKKAKDVLHFNMPYYENFLILTESRKARQPIIEITIMVNVWGDFSPVLLNIYKFQVSGDSPNGSTTYQITEKSENLYLHEESDKLGISESDKLKNSVDFLMKNYEEKLEQTVAIQQLLGLKL